MKKTVLVSALALVIGFSSGAMAQQPTGGYTGPSAVKSATVAEALSFSDDTPVVLTGKIEKSLGDEKYMFADNSGKVVVEIDNEDWRGQNVGADDVVEIKGDVDKEFLETTIDVESITKK